MTHLNREIILTRNTEAIQIPSGHPLELPAGVKVIITQSLGSTYTVLTPGGLVRIDEKDSDALGIDQKVDMLVESAIVDGNLEEAIWKQLKTVFDPEIPVNIVDLGLIYECQISNIENELAKVVIKMTLTAPGCGMGPTIAGDVRRKVLALDGIESVEVELVWDPPWHQSMISEIGKMKLGII